VLVTAPLASRAEDTNQACTDGQGVTLVVDFQSLGGGVNVRCGAQPIGNGYEVFRHANVSYETVSGKDFICRIAGAPDDANCSNYPPGDYYWSYWWAKPGQDWQYSTKGAGAHKPSPGAYEGWSFVSSDTASPPRYPVPPAPTTTTTTATAAAGTAAAGTALTTATTMPVRSSGPPRAATTHTDVTTTTSTTLADVAPPTSVALGHVDLTQHGTGGGTSLGFILSGLAVTLLAAIAIVVVRAR
jgi:hypothetical protein